MGPGSSSSRNEPGPRERLAPAEAAARDGGVRGDDGGGAGERWARDAPAREMSLVLASGSPRRKQLLEMLGLPFRVVAPGVDETRESSEPPEAYVVRLAREKARGVAARERRS